MTPEQKQRIEQIEKWQESRRGLVHSARKHADLDASHPEIRMHGYIDFLLSLVKSQEVTDGGDVRVLNQIRERAADGYERASGGSEVKAANLALNDLHYVLSSHDGQFARGATSMRSACIEKVNKKASSYQADADNKSLFPNYRKQMGFAASALREAASELELVSIQEQETKQS